jgi:hypothetical protein
MRRRAPVVLVQKKGETRTCYMCHKVGHIAPHCPQKTDKTPHGKNTTKTKNAEGGSPKREYKGLSSWKYFKPNAITKSHKDGKIEDDPSAATPLGPPVLTTNEPGSGTEDEDEITFTGAWYTPVVPLDDGGNNEGGTSPVAY